MKKYCLFLIMILFLSSCRQKINLEYVRTEIFQTEKAFEKMVSEQGIAEAFSFFAADSAVIKRGDDSLIKGRENIRLFYENNPNPDASLQWTPEYIDVSECGTLGYTYGKYGYSVTDTSGKTVTNTGIFHTVWKKQNGEWKFVWD